jgi:hypothetical protein
MASPTDNLNPPPAPQRVYYSTGRMLGVDDFQADQDYHRARLARALLQLCGTGTVTGLNVVIEPPVWQANTAYGQLAFVYDSSNNLQVNTGAAGTSGSALTFATAPGGTVNDATPVVWTNEGPIIPAGWQPGKLFTYPSAIVDSNNNIQILTVKPNFTTGSGSPPVWSTTIGGPTNDGSPSQAAWTCLGAMQIELEVTAGLAIDRVGRLIDVPRTVCIILNNWLSQQIACWQNQLSNPVAGQVAMPDPNLAIHNGNLICDVFATFVPCTQGLTPCFATEDDYDATDAFSANRYLDSFAMQLVLRTDATPLTPADPWQKIDTLPAAGSALTGANETAVQNLLLAATAGPVAAVAGSKLLVEYPPNFDQSSVFLARISFPAKAGATGQPPTYNLAQISQTSINNNSRLFVYPAGLLARLSGLGAGAET